MVKSQTRTTAGPTARAPQPLSPDHPDFVLPPLDEEDFGLDVAPEPEPPHGTAEAVAEVPARRPRGRPRKSEGAPVVPRSKPASRLQAAAPAPPAVPSLSRTEPAAEPSEMTFAQALQLWRRLHPQGQRAAQRYIASLLIEA